MSEFELPVELEALRRERAKARELRQSPWWKRRIADGVCEYCRRRVGHRALTMDHVVPLAARPLDARQRRARLQGRKQPQEVACAGRVAGRISIGSRKCLNDWTLTRSFVDGFNGIARERSSACREPQHDRRTS